MSILDTFDIESKEIINPAEAIAGIDGFPETVLVCFSENFEKQVTSMFDMTLISELTGGRRIPIYKFEYEGKEIGFYHTLLGGAGSVGILEEIIAKGAKKLLFFGSCGSLDKNITAGKLLVPTEAYRDEGTSYHYAPPADYIQIRTADRLAEIFEAMKVPYKKIKVWTTDAFYRETEKNMEKRKQEGCAAVEMECASVMAAGQYRGIEVYQFLYAADCLDGECWDKRILGNMPDDMCSRILRIALETVIRI